MDEFRKLNKHSSQLNTIARALIRRARPIEKRKYDELPKIHYHEGYSIIYDAVVGIDGGLYPSRVVPICKFAQTYKGEILLRRVKPVFWAASAKSIMSLLILEAEKGSRLDILVKSSNNNTEGDNNPCDRNSSCDSVALSLYKGITTQDSFPDFNRFLKPREYL